MTRYAHIPPFARRPLPEDVPPSWKEPSPQGIVLYPQPTPPGAAYLPDVRDIYCAGGAQHRGVSLAAYGGVKDRRMLQERTMDPYMVQPVVPVLHAGSRSVDPDADLYGDDMDEWDDFDDLDSFGAELAAVEEEDDREELMEMFGLDEREMIAIEAFGAEPSFGAAKPRRRLFKRRAAADPSAPPSNRPKLVDRFQRGLQRIEQSLETASHKVRTARDKLEEAQVAQVPQPVREAFLAPTPVAAHAPKGPGVGMMVGVGLGAVLLGLGLGYVVGTRTS
jgi:hypothetical protein